MKWSETQRNIIDYHSHVITSGDSIGDDPIIQCDICSELFLDIYDIGIHLAGVHSMEELQK